MTWSLRDTLYYTYRIADIFVWNDPLIHHSHYPNCSDLHCCNLHDWWRNVYINLFCIKSWICFVCIFWVFSCLWNKLLTWTEQNQGFARTFLSWRWRGFKISTCLSTFCTRQRNQFIFTFLNIPCYVKHESGKLWVWLISFA